MARSGWMGPLLTRWCQTGKIKTGSGSHEHQTIPICFAPCFGNGARRGSRHGGGTERAARGRLRSGRWRSIGLLGVRNRLRRPDLWRQAGRTRNLSDARRTAGRCTRLRPVGGRVDADRIARAGGGTVGNRLRRGCGRRWRPAGRRGSNRWHGGGPCVPARWGRVDLRRASHVGWSRCGSTLRAGGRNQR